MEQSTQNSRLIKADAITIYKALTDPKGLETWQVPAEMTGKVHYHDLREGGGYTMSLYYPESEDAVGKTSAREDRYTATYIKLEKSRKIIESIKFDTQDLRFSQEMTMEITLEPSGKGTEVTILFKNIPEGISPEDNEQGTLSSLEKLAGYVEC